jgi:CheY-like chemotaxis protein
VLVVDDDENVRSFMETVLQMEGYRVVSAQDGAQALEMARKETPDLIITDLMMPEAGGFDVLRGMQMGEGRKVPIIVSTARRMDLSTEEMIRSESNVIGLILKPIDVPALLALIQKALNVQPKNS